MNEPDGMDYYVMGTILAIAEKAKEPLGAIKALINSYAVARDLDPMRLAIVALDYPERIRRIEQATTACDLLDEADKRFGGER